MRARHVTIRLRADGIIELAPTLTPLEPADRLSVIVTVLLAMGGLFLCGAAPAGAVAAVTASCVAGEIVLGLKAIGLALLRPAAPVQEVPRFSRRRAR